MRHCPFYWGSHGCDRQDEHTIHQCGIEADWSLCSQYDEPNHLIRFNGADDSAEILPPEWSDWMPATTHGWYRG